MNWPYGVSMGGPVVVGADYVDTLLAQPYTGAPPEILTGAEIDQDLLGLGGLVSAGGPIVVGAEDILVDPQTGAPLPRPRMVAPGQQGMTAREFQLARQVQALAAQNQQLKQPPLGQRAQVVDSGKEKYSQGQIGFDSETLIVAGGFRDVRKQPQKRAKPYRLIIQNPEWWRILDVLVGNKSQFISAGAIPGIMFSADATNVTFVGDTAAISQDIIVRVENRTGADHRFEAGMICHVVD